MALFKVIFEGEEDFEQGFIENGILDVLPLNGRLLIGHYRNIIIGNVERP